MSVKEKWYNKYTIKEEDKAENGSNYFVYGSGLIDMGQLMPFLRELCNNYEEEIYKMSKEVQVFKDAWNEVTKHLIEHHKTQNSMGSTLNEYLMLCEKSTKMIVEKEKTIRELKLKVINKSHQED